MVTIINNQPAEFVHSIVTYTKNLGSPIKKKKKRGIKTTYLTG